MSQVDAWFASAQPRPRRLFGTQTFVTSCLLFVLMISMFGAKFNVPEVVCLALPPLALAMVVTVGWRAGRRRKQCRESLSKAWEHLQLDSPAESATILEQVLRIPIMPESDLGQAMLLLGGVAERMGSHDAAARAYELMLVHQAGDIIQLQEAQVNLAEAKVRNHELTDAVTLIHRLAQVPMPPPIKAVFELVRLFQEVFMGHAQDALVNVEERRSLFRKYLSIRAGFGYGLLAAAYHQVGQTDSAASLWLDATTLAKPDRLIREYALLEPISRLYPAARNPL
ncbi:MAG: hypothetical protein AABZ08_00180 [Planctomycetota bacterium]